MDLSNVQLPDLSLTVPVGYITVLVGLLLTGWVSVKAFKKAVSMGAITMGVASQLVRKFAFNPSLAGALFAGGLSLGGFTLGELANTADPGKHVDNKELYSLVVSAENPENAKQLVQLEQDSIKAQEAKKLLPTPISTGLLGLAVALIVSGVLVYKKSDYVS